jgi:glycosyltransferase involved in cell wall biosynthesis
MLGESMAVYECYDEHTAIPNLRASTRKRYHSLEQQLLRKVDIVFTTSIPLLEVKSPFHSRIFCSHNAADTEFFSRIQQSDVPVSTQCPLRGKPIVGYLGTIHEHTDLKLLRQAAEARPDWGFLLIGTIQKGTDLAELDRLKNLGNVYLPGWVDGTEFMALLKLFDVGIIPYKSDSDFNRFVNPNKVHEYTAMGKPVVATRVCDLSTHGEFVTIVDDLQSFLAAIETAYLTDSPAKIAARLQSAAKNNWDARAADIFEHLAVVRAELA